MNMSRTKIVQIGLSALCERWPNKNWATLPNEALFKIGLAINESESYDSWGALIYLPQNIDQMIDEMLEYNEDLYYTRSGKGYVYDDGLHAWHGKLESFRTIN